MTSKAKEVEVEEKDAGEKKARAKARRRVRCPVCEGHGHQVSAKEATCKCETCGVLFLNPRPSVGELLKNRDRRFADALTADHSAAIRSDAQAALEAMRGYHLLVSGKDAPLNAFGKRMLDIGCSLGFRLREFEKYGWGAMGVEPSANARAYTQAVMIQVVEGDFDSLPCGPFDLILLEDVIEEVAEPKKLVAAIRESLSPQGVVCVSMSLPNEEEEEVLEGKLYCFNEDSLRKLFMQSGFAEPHVKDEAKLRLWFKLKRR